MDIDAAPKTFRSLSDRELIAEVQRLADRERRATADVIAALMELDARRLYLAEGCSSLFTYCTQVLRFSEHAAYGRIEAARAARRFPRILSLLADGSLTLTSVGLLAPHLTAENHAKLLGSAKHKSKREVERMAAAIRPLPDVASSVRKLPEQRSSVPAVAPIDRQQISTETGQTSSPAGVETFTAAVEARPAAAACVNSVPAKPAVVMPLAPERYKVQVTISREAHDHLRRAQDLLRHVVPNGDPAAILERALALLVEDLERKKLAAARRPWPGTPATSNARHVPAAVKREVWARDRGQCAFVGSEGRCREGGFLEFHHVVPYADGGATDVANLQLRCRAHNVHEASEWFGPLTVKERATTYDSSVRAESVPGLIWRPCQSRKRPASQSSQKASCSWPAAQS